MICTYYLTNETDSGPYRDGLNIMGGFFVSSVNIGINMANIRRIHGKTKDVSINFQSFT